MPYDDMITAEKDKEEALLDCERQFEVNDPGVDLEPIDPLTRQRTCRACGWGGYNYLLVEIGGGLPWCFCPNCGDYVA